MAGCTESLPLATGVFWDLENCRLPSDPGVPPQAIASNVREFAMAHGRITYFAAYADSSRIGQSSRLGLQQAGVNVLETPHQPKEAVEKAMSVDMCLFALENKVPATIILISGDRDYANALQRLRQFGYRVVVVSELSSGDVPYALRFAAENRTVHDWHALATQGISTGGSSRRESFDSIGSAIYVPPPPPPRFPPSTDPPPPSPVSSAVFENRPPSGGLCGAALKKLRLEAIARLPPNLPTKLLDRLPPRCARAIIDFWASNPKAAPIQHPYAGLVAHINSRCPEGLNYKVFGYTKFLFLLRDAQAAGLLWLRPGSKMDVKGRPFAEVAPVPHACLSNPVAGLYWLALGFSHEEAQAYRQVAQAKVWGDEVVGVLASNSPYFDAGLHSRWYFATAGKQAWAVRKALQKQEQQQRGGGSAEGASQQQYLSSTSSSTSVDGSNTDSQESSGSGNKTASPPPRQYGLDRAIVGVARGTCFPSNCAEAIAEFWTTHPAITVQSPYVELERHIQTRCGGYVALGYDSLLHLLRAAQTAGLLWLRPVRSLSDDAVADASRPVAEAVQVQNMDITNPSHAMYWLVLGFSEEEAAAYLRKAQSKNWADEIVAKLARNSPLFDAELHARWFHSVQCASAPSSSGQSNTDSAPTASELALETFRGSSLGTSDDPEPESEDLVFQSVTEPATAEATEDRAIDKGLKKSVDTMKITFGVTGEWATGSLDVTVVEVLPVI